MAKGPEAFRTISEAADEVGLAQHVLRFWETKFHFLRPLKRAGGRRFYRPRDVAMLAVLKRLLHEQGLSIKDVQGLYRSQGARLFTSGAGTVEVGAVEELAGLDATARLASALEVLVNAKARLVAVLTRS